MTSIRSELRMCSFSVVAAAVDVCSARELCLSLTPLACSYATRLGQAREKRARKELVRDVIDGEETRMRAARQLSGLLLEPGRAESKVLVVLADSDGARLRQAPDSEREERKKREKREESLGEEREEREEKEAALHAVFSSRLFCFKTRELLALGFAHWQQLIHVLRLRARLNFVQSRSAQVFLVQILRSAVQHWRVITHVAGRDRMIVAPAVAAWKELSILKRRALGIASGKAAQGTIIMRVVPMVWGASLTQQCTSQCTSQCNVQATRKLHIPYKELLQASAQKIRLLTSKAAACRACVQWHAHVTGIRHLRQLVDCKLLTARHVTLLSVCVCWAAQRRPQNGAVLRHIIARIDTVAAYKGFASWAQYTLQRREERGVLSSVQRSIARSYYAHARSAVSQAWAIWGQYIQQRTWERGALRGIQLRFQRSSVHQAHANWRSHVYGQRCLAQAGERVARLQSSKSGMQTAASFAAWHRRVLCGKRVGKEDIDVVAHERQEANEAGHGCCNKDHADKLEHVDRHVAFSRHLQTPESSLPESSLPERMVEIIQGEQWMMSQQSTRRACSKALSQALAAWRHRVAWRMWRARCLCRRTELLPANAAVLGLLARLTKRRCSLIVRAWRARASDRQRMRYLSKAGKTLTCLADALTRRIVRAWAMAVDRASSARARFHAVKNTCHLIGRRTRCRALRCAWGILQWHTEACATANARLHRVFAQREREWDSVFALGVVRGWKMLAEDARHMMTQAAQLSLVAEMHKMQHRNEHLIALLHEARVLVDASTSQLYNDDN